MRNSLLLCLLLAFVGCKSATRLSIQPEEADHHFIVRHSLSQTQAFNKTEAALAEVYNDLPRVLVLKQPDTGTLILKPLVQYQVGGALGQTQRARYTLKIVVSDKLAALDFVLGREETSGWNSYPPETEIPKIRAEFRSIAEKIAQAVAGTVEP